ncbi:MAG: cobalt-precorrin-5B (C(1))-methyltransferase [Euryarchaeota archaeon]|nr:cobalt-precorrin-5B (C(1))-methyltransferase [Euryarchaeota archaeon]
MVRDPVTDYEYPHTWVNACTDKQTLKLAAEGLGVLTSTGKVLKRGFTTGTTAAAACKAAVLSLKNRTESVDVKIPCGLIVTVPVKAINGTASAWKYPGDYKGDVTAGLEFRAFAVEEQDTGISFSAGRGIGRFVRDTPRYKTGEPAISKPSRQSIKNAIQEALTETGLKGIHVKLEIPEGVKTGKKTLNPKVGVEGGISVLGSTGLVEPWDDHLSESVFSRISSADKVVITTGRIGLRYSRMLFPDHEVVLVGVNMQKGIDSAKGEIILCGLPALILKFINPEILTDSGYKTVEEMTTSPEWMEIIKENLSEYKSDNQNIRVVIINRDGNTEGDSG